MTSNFRFPGPNAAGAELESLIHSSGRLEGTVVLHILHGEPDLELIRAFVNIVSTPALVMIGKGGNLLVDYSSGIPGMPYPAIVHELEAGRCQYTALSSASKLAITLRIRFTDGSSLNIDIIDVSESTVSYLFAQIDELCASTQRCFLGRYCLVTPEKRILGKAEEDVTLAEAGIVDNCILSVLSNPKGHVQPKVKVTPLSSNLTRPQLNENERALLTLHVTQLSGTQLMITLPLTSSIGDVIAKINEMRTDGDGGGYYLESTWPRGIRCYSGDSMKTFIEVFELEPTAERIKIIMKPLEEREATKPNCCSDVERNAAMKLAPDPSPDQKNSTLLLRFPDGASVQHACTADTTIQEICSFIESIRADEAQNMKYRLVSPYPKRYLEPPTSTVGDLGLKDRSTVLVESTPEPPSGMRTTSYLGGILSGLVNAISPWVPHRLRNTRDIYSRAVEVVPDETLPKAGGETERYWNGNGTQFEGDE